MTNDDFFRRQARRFDRLVQQGEYDEFRHSPHAVRLVSESVRNVLSRFGSGESVEILDFGCGDGQWLPIIVKIASELGVRSELYGCDISEAMLARAKVRASGLSSKVHLSLVTQSFVAPPASFTSRQFDLIFLYDVLQQFPMGLQYTLCEALLGRLKGQGTLLILDHDMMSRYGLARTAKKILTRYGGVPLLARHQCYAFYPCLRSVAARLARSGAGVTDALRYEPVTAKYALEIVRARGA